MHLYCLKLHPIEPSKQPRWIHYRGLPCMPKTESMTDLMYNQFLSPKSHSLSNINSFAPCYASGQSNPNSKSAMYKIYKLSTPYLSWYNIDIVSIAII